MSSVMKKIFNILLKIGCVMWGSSIALGMSIGINWIQGINSSLEGIANWVFVLNSFLSFIFICIGVVGDMALKSKAHEKEEKRFIVEQDFWGETNSDLE